LQKKQDLAVLQTNGSGVLSFAGVSAKNTPAFFAKLTSNQSITTSTVTKITIDSEVYDSDNCYDPTTNYRFTPNVAGKYFVFGSARFRTATGNGYSSSVKIRKNGSTDIVQSDSEFQVDVSYGLTENAYAIIDMNGTTDYLELFGYYEWHGGTTMNIQATSRTYFGAYKIIE
jgi:hypothetical protein